MALDATYRPLGDGKSKRNQVAARKLRRTNQGQDGSALATERFGVFDAKDKALYMERRKIDKAETEFTVTVTACRRRAGLTREQAVDRSPGDNTVSFHR